MMDLIIKSYGLIERDVDENIEEEVCLKDSVKFTDVLDENDDYFGLDDSDDDISQDPGAPSPPVRPTTVDTLIDAYQLNEIDFGPEQRLSHSDFEQKKSKRVKRDVPCVNTTVLPHESDCDHRLPVANDTSNRPHDGRKTGSLFRTYHDLQVPTSSSSSLLPKCLKWKLTGHRGCVNTLHWGTVPFSNLLLSASMDGTARIWDVMDRGKCIWDTETRLRSSSKEPRSAVRCARWDTTGRLAALGSYDATARVIDVETGDDIFCGVHRSVVNCLRFHPSESHAMICGTDRRIECWDTRERCSRPIRSFSGDIGEIQDLVFLKDGSEFVSCSNSVTRDSADKSIMAWDYRTGAVLSNQIFNERYHCTCLRVHPSDSWFVAQTNGNYAALFSASRPYRMNKRKRYEGHKVEGYWIGCDISPDGQLVYSGSADGFLYAYSFWKASRLARFRVADTPCLAVEAHPILQSTVAVSDMKGFIYIWQ